jgi:hypothetical protein
MKRRKLSRREAALVRNAIKCYEKETFVNVMIPKASDQEIFLTLISMPLAELRESNRLRGLRPDFTIYLGNYSRTLINFPGGQPVSS